MKIVLFGDARRLGALDQERVVDLHLAYAALLRKDGSSDPDREALERLGPDLATFIEKGDGALDAAEEALTYANGGGGDTDLTVLRSAVKLHAPWPGRRIACAGGNYADHIAGMQGGTSIEEVTETVRASGQWGFWKVPAEVAGPDDEVLYPKRTEYLDYEGEVGIVVGKRGKDVQAAQIGEYVWGITLLDDISIRDGIGRAFAMSYNQAKNFDGATAMGPAIVVREDLNPQNIDVELRINGELRQSYNTSAMIFSFGEILQYLSADFTFVPGDVISGGTAMGTAADKTPRPQDGAARATDLFLHPGDSIEISSPQIGEFTNRIVGPTSNRVAR